ncbi:MAG: hypothetical protein H6R18_2237 [Proteobacteria bacterium]|nr:hypothetical protein [Pseudomonadota bacterium]
MTLYLGSCHCGAVRYEINAVINRVTECNCSICTKKGVLHHRVTAENFRLLSDESQLGTYQFGSKIAKHHFCKVCGIHTFSRPRAAPEQYTVNVRTLDNFDFQREQPEIESFDGQHWEEAFASLK